MALTHNTSKCIDQQRVKLFFSFVISARSWFLSYDTGALRALKSFSCNLLQREMQQCIMQLKKPIILYYRSMQFFKCIIQLKKPIFLYYRTMQFVKFKTKSSFSSIQIQSILMLSNQIGKSLNSQETDLMQIFDFTNI